jgi:peptidoglycan/LPS O-acetylase OafA/YrhL
VSARRTEIDRLKGLAILGVLVIHAGPLVGTLPGRLLVDRAVPVLLVLFGLTSELWWQRHAGGRGAATVAAWLGSRVRRLMVPLWGALALWWLGVVALGWPPPLAPRFVVATALGYLPWIGTGWFVTLILALVVLFPALRWAVVRFGAPACLGLAAVATVASHVWTYEITAALRVLLRDSGPRAGLEAFFYFWIFPPKHFFGVVAGIVLARCAPGRVPVAAATAALALGWVVSGVLSAEPRALEALAALLDVPLTVVLLAVLASVPLPAAVAAPLAWCGRASWGIYLGQMLIHDGLHGLDLHPEAAPLAMRWLYAGALLVGAVTLTVVGGDVRRRGARVLGGRSGPR